MVEFDNQEKRIMALLGAKKLDVTRATLKRYLQYLKRHVEFPCQLTGIEDFGWEEFYVFGPGNKSAFSSILLSGVMTKG